MITTPAPGIPSLGSAGHSTGSCKPCAFLHTKGCEKGPACQFCHLCDAGEKKRRRREKQRSVAPAALTDTPSGIGASMAPGLMPDLALPSTPVATPSPVQQPLMSAYGV